MGRTGLLVTISVSLAIIISLCVTILYFSSQVGDLRTQMEATSSQVSVLSHRLSLIQDTLHSLQTSQSNSPQLSTSEQQVETDGDAARVLDEDPWLSETNVESDY